MVQSAGILTYRKVAKQLQCFLVHPGGPFFLKKDDGFWTIPKGLVEEGEDLLSAARREFLEETGVEVFGEFLDLGYVVQKGGKRVHCFAVQFDLNQLAIVSNTFQLEWPPGSGRTKSFAEVDRGEWFDFDTAMKKINAQQAELLQRLRKLI